MAEPKKTGTKVRWHKDENAAFDAAKAQGLENPEEIAEFISNRCPEFPKMTVERVKNKISYNKAKNNKSMAAKDPERPSKRLKLEVDPSIKSGNESKDEYGVNRLKAASSVLTTSNSNSNSPFENVVPCVVFSENFAQHCQTLYAPDSVKYYNPKQQKPIRPDLDDVFLKVFLALIAELNGCSDNSILPIRRLVDFTMKKEMLTEIDRYYRSLDTMNAQELKKFISDAQSIEFSKPSCIAPGVFIIEKLADFGALKLWQAFQIALENTANLWVFCLEPLDILVIIKNESDRLFIEEELTNDIDDTNQRPTTITVNFHKDGSPEPSYTLTTTAPGVIDFTGVAKVQELERIIREETSAENFELPQDFSLAQKEVEVVEGQIVINKLVRSDMAVHQWKDDEIKKKTQKLRPRLFRQQNTIARTLFERVKLILGSRLNDFTGLHVCVATANYTTLKEQTFKRIKDFGLHGGSSEVPVWLYNINEQKRDKPYITFREKVRKNPSTLYVLIADEAHWGYNAKGANSEYVNHPSLLNCENFFVLLVTATPYNILTQQSRLPEKYYLCKSVPENTKFQRGTVVQVKKVDKENGSVLIAIDDGTELSVPVDYLDFEKGEIHIVDWTSTVNGPNSSPEDDMYPTGNKYYGLNHYLSRSQTSVRCDDLFEEMCDLTKNESATLLADYWFSMLFVKRFFERQGKICVPETDAEWQDLTAQLIVPNSSAISLFFDDIFATESPFVKKLSTLKQVGLFYYGKSVGQDNCTDVPNLASFSNFCEKKLRALQSKEQHNHLWTETDKIVLSFLDKAQKREGILKMLRIGSDTKGRAKKILSGDEFVSNLKWMRKKLGWNNLFGICPDFGNFNIHSHLSPEFYDLIQRQFSCGHSTKSMTHCPCTEYKPKMTRVCRDCGHEHKKLESYEDIGTIPVLLILVAKGRLGDTFPKSMDCLDLRIRHRNAPGTVSGAVQELGRMCRYAGSEAELPYSLISKALHVNLKPTTSENAAAAEHFTDMTLDIFMTERVQDAMDAPYAPFKWRRRYQAKKSDKDKEQSMDVNALAAGPHKNRLLLMAEPQIGKTESYLRFWEMLKHEIEGMVVVPAPQFEAPDPARINPDTCLLPYWKYLKPTSTIKFHEHKWGKYHPGVFAKRYTMFKTAAEAVNNTPMEKKLKEFVEKYKGLINDDKYAHLTKNGKSKLDLLDRVNFPFENLSQDENVFKFVNWDGFFDKSKEKIKEISLVRPNFESETSLWEDAKYNSVKPVDCFDRFKIALPAHVLSECQKCCMSHLHKNKINITIQPFSYTNTKISIEVPSSIQVSVPADQPLLGADGKLRLQPNVPSVFIPSYRVSFGQAVPEKSLCNYAHATNNQVTVFLVVRESTFARYKEVWGNKCVIVCLPETMVVNGKTQDVKKGGIGYARLFIQVFGYHHLGLHWIHMWDDNVQRCWKLNLRAKAMEPVFFDEIMTRFQEVARPTEELVKRISDSNDFQAINAPQINFTHPVQQRDLKSKINSAEELMGFDPAKIALIGMGRWHQALFKVQDPFQQRIVYSAVYLNAKLTLENGCLYPCKPVMEDIDFQHLCFDNDLHVIKLNQFIHTKLNWTPKMTIEPLPKSLIELTDLNIEVECIGGESEDKDGLLHNWINEQDKTSTLFLSSTKEAEVLQTVTFIPFSEELKPGTLIGKTEIVYLYPKDVNLQFAMESCLPLVLDLPGVENITKIAFIVPVSKVQLFRQKKLPDPGHVFRLTSTLCRPLQNNKLQFHKDSHDDVIIFVLERVQLDLQLKIEKMEM